MSDNNLQYKRLDILARRKDRGIKLIVILVSVSIFYHYFNTLKRANPIGASFYIGNYELYVPPAVMILSLVLMIHFAIFYFAYTSFVLPFPYKAARIVQGNVLSKYKISIRLDGTFVRDNNSDEFYYLVNYQKSTTEPVETLKIIIDDESEPHITDRTLIKI